MASYFMLADSYSEIQSIAQTIQSLRSCGAVDQAKSAKLDIPSHVGRIWLDGDVICLQFPAIEDIKVAGRPPLEIVSHLVRLPADETGIAAAEMILHVRRTMMTKGDEAPLLAFAKHGTDRSEILRLYRELLP